MLPIRKINVLFDFQLPGNNYNLEWYLFPAPQDKLLTFHYDVVGGGELIIFEARKVKKIHDTIEFISTVDLIANKPTLIGNGHYEEQLLITNELLEKGLYYFYMSDGINERKSELFCVIDGFLLIQTGEIFNIFNTTGYFNQLILDDSGNSNSFILKNGRCIDCGSETVYLKSETIDFTGYTVENGEDIQYNIAGNTITFEYGKIYNLKLSKAGEPTLHFPIIENWCYIHDINRNERLGVSGGTWQLQDDYFYLGGMTKITSLYSQVIYIPYNQYGGTCFNPTNLNTNKYRSGVDFTLNEIFKYLTDYYKVITSFTASDFVLDDANYSII